MCEINEKDLEKATGGVQFLKSTFCNTTDDESGAVENAVDLNGCCGNFDRAPSSTNSKRACENCLNLRRDTRNGVYYCLRRNSN